MRGGVHEPVGGRHIETIEVERVAGGGIAAQLTNKVSAKFEYLHFDLGRFSYSVIGGSEIWNATTKVSGDMVRFGLNYKISP